MFQRTRRSVSRATREGIGVDWLLAHGRAKRDQLRPHLLMFTREIALKIAHARPTSAIEDVNVQPVYDITARGGF